MSANLQKLTPQQIAQIPIYQQKWRNVALSTAEIDREKTIDAINLAYDFCGLEQPQVVFSKSPYSAMNKVLPELESLIQNSVSYKVKHLFNQAWNLFAQQSAHSNQQQNLKRPSEISIHLHTTFYFKFIEYMKVAQEQLQIDLAEVLELKLDVNLAGLFHSLQEQLQEKYDSNFIPGVNFCSYASWLDFWSSEFNYTGDKDFIHLVKILATSCPWIFPYQKVVVVCDRPRKISFNSEQRLHSEGEPAIEFADGYRVYAYSGVILPDKYGVTHPHQWQPHWLLTETNAEVRRVLMQGIGYARIMQELQATELDNYREYTLLKVNSQIDIEPIYLLKMHCPSTGLIHVLRVPPNTKSAKEAITWVNWGIAPEDFVLQT
ncbi:DUF6745 domain-containing protein [Calothrix sp. 336/3]|uniref:DUF6745 domain-containing protein n=1 Tax=Calothrix sp. 336/3 TaxID=1337936 RepID=UPI0004E43439|nr:hypothetical protein [Calothrix sp. 336/3]AKG23961.1 hypothetical protein IJ00_24010 [Calothrix sp. 336/3]